MTPKLCRLYYKASGKSLSHDDKEKYKTLDLMQDPPRFERGDVIRVPSHLTSVAKHNFWTIEDIWWEVAPGRGWSQCLRVYIPGKPE